MLYSEIIFYCNSLCIFSGRKYKTLRGFEFLSLNNLKQIEACCKFIQVSLTTSLNYVQLQSGAEHKKRDGRLTEPLAS